MPRIPSTPPMSTSSSSPPPTSQNGTSETLTFPAVLFKGPPLSIFPSVASHIASQLRLSPPAPLKVLSGALIPMEKTKLNHFLAKGQEYRVSELFSVSLKGLGWRNEYAASTLHVQGRRYHYDAWDTIDNHQITYSSPPTRMLSLFDGMFQFQLAQIFETFGGQVVDAISPAVTHVVGLTPSYTTSELRPADGFVAIHPTWITSSIMHGFLLPASLFVLSFENPLFKYQQAPSRPLPPFLNSGSNQKPLHILSVPIEFSIPFPPTLPAVEPQPCFLNRRIYFDLNGPHLQLVRAVCSVVSRLGGQIVGDPRACNWIVTQSRSGSSYLYGIRHPEIIMGTLEHIVAHIKYEEEEPLDPRSNLLHYPLPSASSGNRKNVGFKSVYISRRYPSGFRRYLTNLVFLLAGQPPLTSGNLAIPHRSIIIAPCSELYKEDEIARKPAELNILLPKVLEDSFLHFDSPPIFDFVNNEFRESKFECFSPKKLPKNFHLAEFKGERIPEKLIKEWSDLETRWDLHAKFDTTKGCECAACPST